MIVMDSYKNESNNVARAAAFSYDDGETLKKAVHQEDEAEDTFGASSSTDIGLQFKHESNGHHRAQHENVNMNGDDDDDESCLKTMLAKVSGTGMSSVGSVTQAQYKPVRQSIRSRPPQASYYQSASNNMHNDAMMKRCNSDPPFTDENDEVLNQISTSPQSIKSAVVRRRPTASRRKSELFGVREPMMNQNPMVPPPRPPPGMNKNRNTPESRQSFELKQNALFSMQTDGTLEQLSAVKNLRVEEQWQNSQNFWRRLALQASAPDTSQKELIQRSTFLVISSTTVGAGILWGFMYVMLEEWTAALMPFIYSTCMSIILFTCICNTSSQGKGYDTFVECQLGLILLLPFAVHVALGGVEKSGGVMLWSFLCPMGAAFFRTADESLRWFFIYLSVSLLLLIKGFWDASNAVYQESNTGEDLSYETTGDALSTSASSPDTIQQLYFLMNIIGVKCIIFSAVFLFARELEKEYSKSEEVLMNILPSSIVKRIKRGEFPIVDHVADVTILFADLVGFTKASTELHPNFLIGLFLRDIFQAFDELVYKHGLEKIKTIGDAYMVVGGLNHGEKLSSHSVSQSAQYKGQKPDATNIMMLAVDMFTALDKVNQKYNLQFDLRIGVHTGPVVAGVLGLKRFTYDVWGDSVNTASRMESNGVPAHIHLSSDMYESVMSMTNVFNFSCCGKIDIKGKGEMVTYLARPLRDKNEKNQVMLDEDKNL